MSSNKSWKINNCGNARGFIQSSPSKISSASHSEHVTLAAHVTCKYVPWVIIDSDVLWHEGKRGSLLSYISVYEQHSWTRSTVVNHSHIIRYMLFAWLGFSAFLCRVSNNWQMISIRISTSLVYIVVCMNKKAFAYNKKINQILEFLLNCFHINTSFQYWPTLFSSIPSNHIVLTFSFK